jgi:hypothetical protein
MTVQVCELTRETGSHRGTECRLEVSTELFSIAVGDAFRSKVIPENERW